MKLTKSNIEKKLPVDYLPRSLESELIKYLEVPEILIIYGARQVGKSTMILNLAQEFVEKYPVHYYSVDYSVDPDLTDPNRMISVLSDDIEKSGKVVLIIDEAQRIKNIGLFVKEIYDKNLPIKIILTGSASFAIKSNVKEPLTGRKFEFQLTPFSLQEIIKFQQINIYKETTINSKLEEILGEYLIYGGYPQVYFTKNPELKAKRLGEIVNTYINRDLVELFNIDNERDVRIVTNYIAQNIGNLLSIDKISNLGGINRYQVEKILNALEKTFVLQTVYPYSQDRFKEVSRTPKIYFHDVGLRNGFLGKYSFADIAPEIGHVFENTILTQLAARYDATAINYWRNINQTEVDFVLKTNQALYGIEVKYDWSGEKLPQALQNFVEKYKAKGQVITKKDYWKTIL